jgi:galactokinase/mevalonate kinase-like predicted kinase
MFFASREKHADIIKSMKGLQRVPFSFDNGGSKIVFSDQIKE